MGWEALMEKWPWEGTGRGQTSCPAPLGLWLAGELLHHGLIPGVLALLGAGGAHVTAAEPPLFLPELATCPTASSRVAGDASQTSVISAGPGAVGWGWWFETKGGRFRLDAGKELLP